MITFNSPVSWLFSYLFLFPLFFFSKQLFYYKFVFMLHPVIGNCAFTTEFVIKILCVCLYRVNSFENGDCCDPKYNLD